MNCYKKNLKNHICEKLKINKLNKIDITEEIKKNVIKITKNNLLMTPSDIWLQANKNIKEKYKKNETLLKLPNRKTIINYIKNSKKKLGINDIYTIIKQEKYACLSETDKRNFFKIEYIYEMPKEKEKNINKLHRLLIWAHPDLLWILRRKHCKVFIDGTFYSVPKPFRQCVVIMAHDDETSLNIPVVYSLLDSKSSWAYWHLFHNILVITEMEFDPITITTDFEPSLLEAVKEQFPLSKKIGCFFHFVYNIRKKMHILKIERTLIDKLLNSKKFKKIIYLKKKKIIKALKKKINKIDDEKNECWIKFLNYFKKQWMKAGIIELWNRTKIKKDEKLVKTNNSMENFNRKLNSKFPRKNPNIFTFIETIKNISCEYVERINNIKSN